MSWHIAGFPIPIHSSSAAPDSWLNYHGRDHVWKVPLKSAQPMVWIGLTSKSSMEKSDAELRKDLLTVKEFPAILDTGEYHELILDEWHLKHWVGLDFSQLPQRLSSHDKQLTSKAEGLVTVRGYDLAICLFGNAPNTANVDRNKPPMILHAYKHGVSVVHAADETVVSQLKTSRPPFKLPAGHHIPQELCWQLPRIGLRPLRDQGLSVKIQTEPRDEHEGLILRQSLWIGSD